LLARVHEPKHEVNIALVGKYIDLPDAYLSISEALRAGGFANWAKVNIQWVESDQCENPKTADELLSGADGVIIPGGFGIRGVEGKIGAIQYAREKNIPILGLCLGLQCMVTEVARSLAGLKGAASTEFDPDTAHPVIATMDEQVDIVSGDGDMGGTMRLGAYPAELLKGSLVASLYGATKVSERHRHRYEVNNAYRKQLEDAGLVISGTSPDSTLVEFIELPQTMHPFFVATQAHPEMKSRPTNPHPLFTGFVEAAVAKKNS
ncbi:MAG: CTP synthase, partial [Propionibacteriaceae bacterium]|nr:CTP synthase [Propionibacteriaceae bacterium]